MSGDYKKEYIDLFGDGAIKKSEQSFENTFAAYMQSIAQNPPPTKKQNQDEQIAAHYIADKIYPNLKEYLTQPGGYGYCNQFFFYYHALRSHLGLFEDNLFLNMPLYTQRQKSFYYCRFGKNAGTERKLVELLPNSSIEQKTAVLGMMKDKLLNSGCNIYTYYISYPQMVQKFFLFKELSEIHFYENSSFDDNMDDQSKSIAKRSKMLNDVLALPSFYLQFANEEYNSAEKRLSSKEADFTALVSTLFLVTDGDVALLNFLAILIAKINMGREAFNMYSKLHNVESVANNLTLLCCNNTNYIKSFFKDIYTSDFSTNETIDPGRIQRIGTAEKPKNPYYVVRKGIDSFYYCTEYTLPQLSKERNVPYLLDDKCYGHMLNIDAANVDKHDVDSSNLNKLLKGHICAFTDELFCKQVYRSNSHYIRIIKNMTQCGFDTDAVKDYDCIQLNSELPVEIGYMPLKAHELFFLHTAFVKYGLDLIKQGKDRNVMPIAIGVKAAAEDFCKKYLLPVEYDEETTEGITYLQDIYKAYEGFINANFTSVEVLKEQTFYDIVKETFPDTKTQNLRLNAAQKKLKVTSTSGNAVAAYGLVIDAEKIAQNTEKEGVPSTTLAGRYAAFKKFFETNFGINCG